MGTAESGGQIKAFPLVVNSRKVGAEALNGTATEMERAAAAFRGSARARNYCRPQRSHRKDMRNNNNNNNNM